MSGKCCVTRWSLVPVVVLALAAGCGSDEAAVEDAAEMCCTCLVDASCVKAAEYGYCKDTLSNGDALQLSTLRDLTCNEDACVQANKCASPNSGGGGSSGEAAGGESSGPNGGDVGGGDGAPVGDGAYILTIDHAEYAGDLDGSDWDAFDQPDPFVSVRIDDVSIGVTATVVDSYYPEWEDEFAFDIGPTTKLSFRFFDADDVSGDDYAGEFVVDDLEGAVADGGGTVTSTGIAVVQFTYSIRHR